MNKYKAIGFDWGGVLVPSKPIVPGIARIVDMPEEDLYRAYLSHNSKAGVGDMSYQDVWGIVLTELGHADKISAAIEHMAQQQSYELDLQMISLVDRLKNDGYKVGLLSNNTKQAGISLREQGLDKHFDSFLISAEIGFQKPDPKAFAMLIDQLEISPEELVFTDDSVPSLSTSAERGYTPLLFTGHDNFVNDLKALNIIN